MSWPSASLGDICEIQIGKTPSRAEPSYWNGGTSPWLSIADMNQGRRLTATKECVTEAGVRAANMKLVQPGTLLLSYKLSIGKVGIADAAMYTNEAIAALTGLDPSVDTGYLYWTLQFIDLLKGADRAAMGATLNKAKLKQLQIPVPPIDEQRRIAAILDKADTLRAKRREAIAKLDQLLQSVFLDMFGDPVTNSRGWPVRSLGDICDVRDGTHDSPKYVDNGHPLVTSKNLASGEVRLEGALLISDEDFAQISKRSKVDQGDVLMPMIGTIGNPVLVDHEPNYAIKNIALLKFGRASVRNTYVLQLLRSRFFAWATAQKSRGGTQKFLALKDIRGMQVPVPDQPTQDRFDALLGGISKQRNHLVSAYAGANQLFAGLQDQAFAPSYLKV